MVSKFSIISMIITVIISFALPIVLLVYFRKKERISFKPIVIGALTFIVFAQVLEKIMHVYVINNNLITNPWIFAVYGALAAGVFEEMGRFVSFKMFLKNNRQWKDGIAFGIGHGGIEAILIAGIMNIQYIVFSNLINTGMLEKMLSGKVPEDAINSLSQLLINTSPIMFLMGGLERIAAVAIQIALSVVVLYAIRYRRYIYVVLAILIHAAIDFPAAMYQMQKANIWVVEGLFALILVAAVIFIKRSRKMFEEE
jgi:uncharacterized membrane protein YhfC